MRPWFAFALVCVSVSTAKGQASHDRLGPGDHARSIESGGRKRQYLVHVPPKYDPARPAPVVLALHGAAMTGAMMVKFTGLNETADREGFIVVYPSGTGTGSFLTWNAGGFSGRMAENRPDDVAFVAAMLDDLPKHLSIDHKRIYACGMSNGGMMCYRLAAELSDRIAAIAPVAGTIAIDKSEPKRPVPVLHIHGRKDRIVPFEGPDAKFPAFMKFKSVEDSVMTWVGIDACKPEPEVDVLSKQGDDMKVVRKTYDGGKNGTAVVLIVLEEGGHTWPGRSAPIRFVGKSSRSISANELIWDFFRQHRLK